MTTTSTGTSTDLGIDLDALVGRLDLEGKVRLLTGAAAFSLQPAPEIGLAQVHVSDGPTGVRGLKFHDGPVVALLPNATLLSAHWDEATMHEVGRLLAEEAMAQGLHVVLGPTINLHRTPLGGRLFEAYSEDPLLSGRLAAAYVRGLQELGVGACLKHFVANESETARNSVNSVVDEATLRELYLLPFEIAVADAQPWMIMDAYNDVNGVAATEHVHANVEILKQEWGFDGVVVSDWFATKTTAASANGGLDLVMPGPFGPWGEALVAAVRAGEVAESVVDDHVRRLLRLAARVGALGEVRTFPTDLLAPDAPERRAFLTRLAASGMTVLKNDEDVLPLARGQKVALIGRHAIETVDMGGGSAEVNPPYQVTVAEGLGQLGGDLTVVDGVEVRTRPLHARSDFLADPQTGEPGVRILVTADDGHVLQDAGGQTAWTVVGFDDDWDDAPAELRFSGRVAQAGPLQVGAIGVGSWRVSVDGQVFEDTLVSASTGLGEEILAPPSRTWVTEPVAAGSVVEAVVDLRTDVTDRSKLIRRLGVVARPAPRGDDAVLAEAVSAAADADVAVVVVGFTEEQETESVDKSTLRLPGRQDELVAAVAAAARRTVVVLNAATPVLMPWLDEVDAVLVAGLPGQEGGHAVAAALLGDVEPAGRLVTSYPVADGASPAWEVVPQDGDLVYAEGPFVGYRGFAAGRATAPLFWLGHGLGYSTWEYGHAALVEGGTADAVPAVPAVPAVQVTVTNTGSRASREVVQVYAEPAGGPDVAGQPVRLVGWTAVDVEPGASQTVTVTPDPRVLRRWDDATAAWTPLPIGRYLVARGLGDIRAELPA